jgi:hypothetical protein
MYDDGFELDGPTGSAAKVEGGEAPMAAELTALPLPLTLDALRDLLSKK